MQDINTALLLEFRQLLGEEDVRRQIARAPGLLANSARVGRRRHRRDDLVPQADQPAGSLLAHPGRLVAMAHPSAALARPHAGRDIAHELLAATREIQLALKFTF